MVTIMPVEYVSDKLHCAHVETIDVAIHVKLSL